MKALVTGGAGFIGSHLAEELLRQGHEVVVIDNFSSGKPENLKGLGLELIKGDVGDFGAVLKASKGASAIFHLAAIVSVQESITDPFETERVNALGTLNVLEAARKNNVKKVIFSSSAAVYGDSVRLPANESSPPKPISPYGITKMLGEYYCKAYASVHGISTCSLRYFNVYGPRQDAKSPYSGVLARFIDAVRQGKSPVIYGDGQQTRDFIYVGDVVRANLLALDNATGEAYNVATGQQSSLNDIVSVISRLLGKNVVPVYEESRPGDILHSVADISKAQKIGFSAGETLSTGLAKTIGL